jgi:hypothetical protein
MRRIAIAMAALLAAHPADAFDPAGIDILGLRLGMPETAIVATLRHQGFATIRSGDAISAVTKDGHLRIVLSAQDGATQIGYVFDSRDSGAAETILDAVLTRFGEPTQTTPMTWCQTIGHSGVCPRGQAALTFLPESRTLLLTNGKGP